MKSNDEFIKGIYQKYEKQVNKSQEKLEQVEPIFRTQKKKLPYFISGIGIVLIFFAIFSFLIHNETNLKIEEEKKLGSVQEVQEINLPKVENFENFYKLAKEQEESATNSRYWNETMEESATNAEKSDSVSQDGEDYSKTNIQENSVDEADIVKTDGRYIYSISHVNGKSKIIITDANLPEQLTVVSVVEEENFTPRELYLFDGKLIVIGTWDEYQYKTVVLEVGEDTSYVSKIKTVVKVYDLQEISVPKEIRRVEVEASYLSSRLIEGNLYFVCQRFVNTSQLLRGTIDEANEAEYLPIYQDSVKEEEKQIGFDEIYYFEDRNDSNYLMMAGINLKEEQKEVEIKTFLGAGEQTYCSEKNMYLATTKNSYNSKTREIENITTQILKFELKDGNINFKADTEIDGYINNQFSMDESKNYFQIATTIGNGFVIDENVSNTLYVLDENLKEVGKLENLAVGERIYSVRYTENRAYIVTFKQVDPLFVIDLQDKRNPKVLGEVKIPGYSTYLHPYDDTHMIGFGYDVTEDGKQTNGIKISMFDLTDEKNPKELHTIKIDNGQFVHSDVLYDHKALLFSKEKNIIAFPITRYQKGKSIYEADVYQYSFENGFTKKGSLQSNSENYEGRIERIIYINDMIYTIAENKIQAFHIDTLEKISEIKIGG